jgi:hypothetical protein
MAALAILLAAIVFGGVHFIASGAPLAAPPLEHVRLGPCPSPPCEETLLRVPFSPPLNLRLNVAGTTGPAFQAQWAVAQLPVIRDDYPAPASTSKNKSAYLFDCRSCQGEVEIGLRLLGASAFESERIEVTTESIWAELSECLLISLPLLVLLAVIVIFAPAKAAAFSMLLLGVLLLYLLFAPAPKSGQGGDNKFYVPAAYQLVRHGSFGLGEYAGRNSLSPYSNLFRTPDGHKVNYYPAAVSVAIAPLVAWSEIWNPPEERLAETIAKIMAAASVAVLFLVCRRLGIGTGGSLLLAGAFAFSTSQFSIHAGGLYSHNVTTLLSMAAIWLLVAQPRLMPVLLAGVCVAGFACRHDFAFLILGCCVTLAGHSIRRLLIYLATMALLVLPVLYGFHELYGQWLPPYLMDHKAGKVTFDNLVALAGLLASPNRGLLLFSPVLALGFVQAVRVLLWHRGRDSLELGLSISAVAFLLVLSTYEMWWGGWSYGPRLFCGLLGPLMVLTALFIRDSLANGAHRTVKMSVFVLLVLWGVVVNGKGALVGDNWNGTPLDVNDHPERLWDVSDLQITRNSFLVPIKLNGLLKAFLP